MDAPSLQGGPGDSRARPPSCRTWRSGTTPRCWWSTQAGSAGRAGASSRADGERILRASGCRSPRRVTGDARERGHALALRKGLYAAVAGARPPGTTALLEDIVVPVPGCWAAPARELIRLFDRHGYGDSVIFGHAKDGNVHFMLTERLRRPRPNSTATAPSPTTWSTWSWPGRHR